jgi:hypothetical protein
MPMAQEKKSCAACSSSSCPKSCPQKKKTKLPKKLPEFMQVLDTGEFKRIRRLIAKSKNHNRRKCNCEGCKWWWLSNVKVFPNEKRPMGYFEILPNIKALTHGAKKVKVRSGKKKKEKIIQWTTVDDWHRGLMRMMRFTIFQRKPKPLWMAWSRNNLFVLREI